MHIESTPVTHIGDKPVFKIHIENDKGVSVIITNYGGIVMKLCVPNKDGAIENVVAGFERVEDYTNDHPYFGCIVGRFANRIAKGKFVLKDEEYQLGINNGPNHLHGGAEGFHRKVWKIKDIIHDKDSAGVLLTYTSADGEENYPGELQVSVKYLLNNANELSLEYTARTDRTTIINLTNHSYFNLSAFHSSTILDHTLQINAKKYLPVDETAIPTGEKRNVSDTPFNFSEAKKIGERLNEVEGGYDHNFILSEIRSSEMKQIATLVDPSSGRKMNVHTDQPGVQFYSGNFLDGSIRGVHGVYQKHAALCLETQHWPDSPNQPKFPSVVLGPGETYHTKTIYSFSIEA
jgi:aldose 1-epimerase